MSLFIFCYAECRYAEGHYAECYCAERRYAKCRFAECHRELNIVIGNPSLLTTQTQRVQLPIYREPTPIEVHLV